jgi:hypothetical protein
MDHGPQPRRVRDTPLRTKPRFKRPPREVSFPSAPARAGPETEVIRVSCWWLTGTGTRDKPSKPGAG